MTKCHSGVELHNAVAQVCVLDERGEVHRERRASLTDCEAGVKVVADLGEFTPPARIAVEALGRNRWLVNSCRAAGLAVPSQERRADSATRQDRVTRFVRGSEEPTATSPSQSRAAASSLEDRAWRPARKRSADLVRWRSSPAPDRSRTVEVACHRICARSS